MFFSEIKVLRKRMNECGEHSVPFLFVLNYELTEGYFVENPIQQSDIFFQIQHVGNKPNCDLANRSSTLRVFPASFAHYQQKFDQVQEPLTANEVDLVNLTIKTPIRTNLPLSEIFMRSQSLYQLYIPNRFVCFSPERFVKIENGKISTNPMKGTIDASFPDAENVILNDFKETDEHTKMVKLACEELSGVASDTQIARFRYIDRIKSNEREILQVSSEISGILPADYLSHLGEIIFQLLPAGSISGVPKKRALQAICDAEKEERGFYTGVFGYFNGNVLDSGVLIRFIEQEDEKQYFRSGGGITRYSNCEKEYQEILSKIYLPFVK